VIGNLNFVRDGQEIEWSEDENILIEEILEQTALALENARLVNQIRLRSDQIQLLQEITAMSATVLDEKVLLDNVAKKLQTSLQVQHCGISLLDDQRTFVELVTSVSSHQDTILVGRQVRIDEDPVTQGLIQNPHITVLQNIEGEPQYQTFVQTFTNKESASLILLPLTIRDQVIGYIFFENEDKNRTIDQEEKNLFNQISAQISSAIESARLFAAEQEGRIAAAALLEITQIASASLDMNQVLNQATNRSAQAIQAHRCTIFLLDEKEKIKPLISIYSDGNEMPEEEWELLQKRVRETYQNFPLHRLAANLRTPKIISNPLSYQNIPLSWAGEFKIENILMVPLISQNKVIGTMIFDQVDQNLTFKQNQEELAQTIAGQIATTIENANLFEQAVHRAERERQVTEITAKIRSSNDPKEIMETAILELRTALSQSSVRAKQPTANHPPSQETDLPNNGKDKAQI
jgi:GAF domain-containing protein